MQEKKRVPVGLTASTTGLKAILFSEASLDLKYHESLGLLLLLNIEGSASNVLEAPRSLLQSASARVH